MKLQKEKLQNYNIGDTRIVHKFAWTPIVTKNDKDKRWLEWVEVLQEVVEFRNYDPLGYEKYKYWKNIKFIDKEIS